MPPHTLTDASESDDELEIQNVAVSKTPRPVTRLNVHLISDEEVLEKLGVTLCMSDQAFDSVYDELMSMEDEDLVKAMQAAPYIDLNAGLCSDGVDSGGLSEVMEGEIDWDTM
jgi:hypothetical protein